MDRDTAIRSGINSMILAVMNLFAILLGFAAFKLVPETSQFAIQVPVAIAGSTGLFVLWNLFLRAWGPERFRMRGWGDGRWILALSLIWAAMFFVPLHYFARGYLTAFSNLMALWGIQLIANTAAVSVSVAALVERGALRSDLHSGRRPGM